MGLRTPSREQNLNRDQDTAELRCGKVVVDFRFSEVCRRYLHRLATEQSAVNRSEQRLNDTGPGLSHGLKNQIFDAFVTTKPQGSGMGIAICKSILESHAVDLVQTPRRPRRDVPIS